MRVNVPPMYKVLPTRAAVFTAPLITKLTREFDDGWASAYDAAMEHKTRCRAPKGVGEKSVRVHRGTPRETGVFEDCDNAR